MMPPRKKFGLLGETLGHSRSPQIHALLGDYAYDLYEVSPCAIPSFLAQCDLDGMNVTIPYKKTVIPFCGELSPRAKRIGSVNTMIRREDGSFFGDNTDYAGFAYLLSSAGISVKDQKCLVLGSGGASLTVCAVLQDLGAREVITVSRSGENHYGNLHLHADATVLVNTTPVGMYPDSDKSPVDLRQLPSLCGVCDLIYNPIKTKLIQSAETLGIPCEGGLSMLVAQAKVAAELFLKKSIPDSKIREIQAEIAKTL